MGTFVVNWARQAIFVAILSSGFLFATASCTVAAGASIRLRWSPTGSDVASYKVYYGTVSGKLTRSLMVGTETGAIISNLTEGSTYFFAVTAVTGAGLESRRSPEISYLVPFGPRGSYYGLFYQAEDILPESAGSLQVSVTKSSYSGRLRQGSRSHVFKGKLSFKYQATNTIRLPGGGVLTVQLSFGSGAHADRVSGLVTDGVWVSPFSGSRAAFKRKSNPSPYAGRYTMSIPGQLDNPDLPMGDGFAAVQIDSGGAVTFEGALADGTKITHSVPHSGNGVWPLYVPLYAGKGLIIGWIAFVSSVDSDLGGVLRWMKPADSRSTSYPAGFNQNIESKGSTYHPPDRDGRPLFFTQGLLGFNGGNLAQGFTNVVVLKREGKASSPGNPGLELSFSTKAGTFKGKVSGPGIDRGTFRGAVFQKINRGLGFLMGRDESSRVTLDEYFIEVAPKEKDPEE